MQSTEQSFYNLLVAYYQGRVSKEVFENFLRAVPADIVYPAFVRATDELKKLGYTLPPLPELPGATT